MERPFDQELDLSSALVDDRQAVHAEWDDETSTLTVWYDRPLDDTKKTDLGTASQRLLKRVADADELIGRDTE
jgi:hypothetical protein